MNRRQLAARRRFPALHVRFTQRVQKVANGCWTWTGRVNDDGYGTIKASGRTLYAHRVSYELAFGPIPDRLCVLHRCDNPPCCNPDHLFLGTRVDNNADRDAKGRAARGERSGARLHPESMRRPAEVRPRGSAHANAVLSEGDIPAIRALLGAGRSQAFVGRQFGVSQTVISRIVRGVAWRHAEAS